MGNHVGPPVEQQRRHPCRLSADHIFVVLVAHVQRSARRHVERRKGNSEDAGVGLTVAHGRTRTDHTKPVSNTQALQMVRKGAVPVAHHPQGESHFGKGVERRQYIVKKAELQALHKKFSGTRQGRSIGPERRDQYARALSPERRETLGIAPHLHVRAIVRDLRTERSCHLRLVVRVPGITQQAREHGRGRRHAQQRAEGVEQDRAHRHRRPTGPMDDVHLNMGTEGATGARVRPNHDAWAAADPVLYSAAVPGPTSTLPQSGAHHSTRRLKGPTRVAVIAGAAVVALWIPSFIATAYAEVPASDYLSNPAKGWGFLLFRLFDITKPFGIKALEKLPSGFGIVLDDVMAAFYANLVLQGLALLWKLL